VPSPLTLQLATWLGNKPRLVVLNRMDMVSRRDKDRWDQHFRSMGVKVGRMARTKLFATPAWVHAP